MTAETLRKTSLWDEHHKLKARMVPFAGYDMPVQYSGVIAEHEAVRRAVGVFDVSHMGIAEVTGKDAKTFLQRALSRDFSQVQSSEAFYTLLCRENGGCVDDLIVYHIDDENFFLVLNASNKEKDLAYLKELSAGFSVQFKNHFHDLSLLALQGPRSEELLQKLGLRESLSPAFRFFKAILGKIPVTICVTGYTGELGCEIVLENAHAPEFWRQLLAAGADLGIRPCGLAARDTLRTEMGYSLYGHELSEEINPLEAGLGWAVSLDKNFVGQTALREAKAHPRRKLICLKNNSKQAPRPEMKVQDASGKVVGFITSGTFGPSVGHAIGLALVEASAHGPFKVLIRDQAVDFELTKRPFYRKQGGN